MSARRVRVARCPACRLLFATQRVRKADKDAGLNVQHCTNCFSVIDGNSLWTWLQDKKPR